ncbi:hypothetical protein CLI92_09205 [Vandammella animalimorsus]|uniref:Uncharacterized protein n=1 Tax=Vandammella animalimorsus TaxID=2029117 RepID=A0A2A2T4L6_9BURK|nr:hypothetical protein [Vandammella animalimorsus]PAT31857.1 hypothetical protein CK626_07600 [Vandammella animalimorsus]PAX16496.1 hypothetical protein CLI92_09205 [Vandammella animalimorsus]PAX18911.1 hypothetical protein CLI93_11285 [Vandammella animalimorsus]
MIESLPPAPQANPFLERRIRQEIDKLGRTDRLAADMANCHLEATLGNRPALWRAIREMEQNGFTEHAGYTKIFYYATALKAGQAHKFLPFALKARPYSASRLLPVLESIGAFQSITALMRQAKEDNIMLQAHKEFERAQSATRIMDELGVTDDIIAQSIDQVGTLLEEKGISTQGHTLLFTLPAEHPIQQPFIHMTYDLPVSIEEAEQLSQELAERIILADLFVSPGFTISFQGKI